MDRQIVFPLSYVLHSNGEKNGQPHLHDFSEDIQFMDIEESSGKESRWLSHLDHFKTFACYANVLSAFFNNTSLSVSGSRLCPFLQEHKDDILCGPVWLSSGLDLSGHAGMLSLTSPKLLKGSPEQSLQAIYSNHFHPSSSVSED